MIVKRSVTTSIARALAGIVLLSVLSTGLALLTLSGSLRDAEAVNIAGSLRMQSYRLAWDSASDPQQLIPHLDLYQQTLNTPALQELNRFWVPGQIIRRYHHLLSAWPVLRQALLNDNAHSYQHHVANYVQEIDRFVLDLQRYAELKMHLVAVCSLVGFVAILALVIWSVRLIRRQVVSPLNTLVTASRSVEQGNFDFPPLPVRLENELGELSSAFHTMAGRLQQHYTLLESTVRDQTQGLIQANHTLGLLYETSQVLTVSRLDLTVFDRILTLLIKREPFLCIVIELESRDRLMQGTADPQLDWQSLPLRQDEHLLGELRWQTDHSPPPAPLMQSLANMLGRAVWIYQRQKQYQQMLLTEERATIARELHDSLAQALSFLRIQLTLLKRKTPLADEEARQIITDFDRALADTWRQLRELLTTFRLTIEQADLDAAMQAMIAALQEQSDAEIHYHTQPGLQTLDAQQQVHVLQIVREALLNAIRHASAGHIAITYQRTTLGEHQLMIEDDGVGIGTAEEPAGHYGLTIMHERAQRLGATLEITSLSRGTRVLLCFPPASGHRHE